MGLFENFPYTNLHDLNLNWILEEVKKLKEEGGYSPENPPPYPVTSVNGKTGAVVLFDEQEGVYVRFPDSENDQWNIYRLVKGVPAGIQFSATLPATRMQGSNRFAIYDEGNPPPYPVTSVNGKTGAVILFSDHDGAYIQFPDSTLSQWNVYRIIDKQTNGIQFHKDGAAVRMQGTNRYQIYDQGNPPPYPVTSVNGLTGAAETPFTDHTDDVLEFVAGAVGASWGLKRTINTGSATDEAEVEFTLQLNDSTGNPEAYIASGETVKKLLTEDDIPSSSGVVSVNGLTGVVTLNGGNLPAAPDTLQTVGQAIAAEAQARTQADTSLNDNIVKLTEGVAIIVDGDTAAVAVPVGGYTYIKNNTHGLTEGMYKNTSSGAFPVSGGIANSTIFSPVPTGAANDLNTNLTNLCSIEVNITESDYHVVVVKYGKVCHLHYETITSPVTDGSVFYTIPDGLGIIPKRDTSFHVIGLHGSAFNPRMDKVTIDSDGNCQFTGLSSGESALFVLDAIYEHN